MPKDTLDTPRPLGEIAHGPSGFERFLERNQKGLVVVAILAALGGVGYVIMKGLQRSKDEDAGAALSKATELVQFQSIIKDFPNSPAAGCAEILAADQLWKEDPDQAVAQLRKFIDTQKQHPARPVAIASLGNKLASQKKTQEAEAAFQEIVSEPAAKFLAPYALLQLGDLAKAAGDLEKAKGFYEQVKNDYGDSGFAMTAGEHIEYLKAKLPVEIDAPPAPPVPPQGAMPGLPGGLPGFPGTLPGIPANSGTPAEPQPGAPIPLPQPEVPKP